MAFFASCAGLQITAGTLMIPLMGAWTADLHLATTTAVSGPVEVIIGNLTLNGAVFRSEAYGGQIRARLVGGFGGWRTSIPPQGYGSSAGVSLTTILNDAATACGEQVSVTNDTSVGNAYARVQFGESVAGDILWQMLSQGIITSWYVAPSGTTMTSAWPTVNVATPYTVTDQKPDEGIVVVATEDYASWMPGCTFTSPLLQGTYTSAGVHYVWDNEGKFRFEVLTGSDPAGQGMEDRVLGPVQQVIQKEISPLRFFGRYNYTISNPSTTTIDGTPVNANLGLPELQNVPLQCDSIASLTPPDGGNCHIMFIDGMPTQPSCVWCEADKSVGPSTITLGPQGSSAPAIARVNDTVTVVFPPLMQIAGTVGVLPFVGVLTITTPGQGIIQTGSSSNNSS